MRPVKNEGKCRLKLYRVRIAGALVFYCVNPEHDHGPKHPRRGKLTVESIFISAEELYAEMKVVQPHKHNYRFVERGATWYNFICRDCEKSAALGMNTFWGFGTRGRPNNFSFEFDTERREFVLTRRKGD